MTRTFAKGVFLAVLAVAAAVLALAVYQVPQPWRGLLVGWLLFLGSVGAVMLRLARHYYSFKSLQLTARPPARAALSARRARRSPSSTRVSGLKVVRASPTGGRRTIR